MSGIPDTPRTAIGRMALGPDAQSRMLWEKSWRTFHGIYLNFIRACTIVRFRKYNWKPSDALIDETVANIFKVLMGKAAAYDTSKGRFHPYLRGIVWRIVWEQIKDKKHDNRVCYLENALKTPLEPPDAAATQLDAMCEAERACAIAALHAEILDAAKKRCSPRMAMIFHMRTVEEKSPEAIAAELAIPRATVDNEKYKFTQLLEKIADEPPFKDELAEVLG